MPRRWKFEAYQIEQRAEIEQRAVKKRATSLLGGFSSISSWVWVSSACHHGTVKSRSTTNGTRHTVVTCSACKTNVGQRCERSSCYCWYFSLYDSVSWSPFVVDALRERNSFNNLIGATEKMRNQIITTRTFESTEYWILPYVDWQFQTRDNLKKNYHDWCVLIRDQTTSLLFLDLRSEDVIRI